MLSITNSKSLQICDIIEEAGGKWIVKDPSSGIYLFASPDPNRHGDYFKLLDTDNSNKYNHIARIGIKSPEYVIHYRNLVNKNVFLKPETIERMNEALNGVHKPSSSDESLIRELLQKKNEQINEFNRTHRQRIPNIQNFNNWQAAIIYTNMINKVENDKNIRNDTRMGEVDPSIIPFDQPRPDYLEKLPDSEEVIKRNIKEARKYKRF